MSNRLINEIIEERFSGEYAGTTEFELSEKDRI